MQIQVNIDSTIEDRESLVARVEQVLEMALSRFRYRISGVEVHLTQDGNGLNDKRCVVVVRVQGVETTTVTHRASTLDEAIDAAADTLKRNLDVSLGRARAVRGFPTGSKGS